MSVYVCIYTYIERENIKNAHRPVALKSTVFVIEMS